MIASIPVIALLLSNLVPIAGVFYGGWDAASIVLVYWAENLIIGFYNILKMLTVAPFNLLAVSGRLFLVLFFMIHYGGFTGVHGMFLLQFLHIGDTGAVMSSGDGWAGPLVFLQILFNVVRQVWVNMPDGIAWPLIALVISHGVSFVYHFILGGERLNTTANKLMAQPYGRIIVMHITILAGGFFMVMYGASLVLLLLLIAVKIAMDIHLHNKSHKGVVEEVPAPEFNGTKPGP